MIKDCVHPQHSAYYLGYFKCFNEGWYYEAHDVLEERWLKNGKTHEDYAFYKGLIQVAGGFVHMKLNYEYPDHRVHGQRLHPAARLLRLGVSNTSNYGRVYQALEISTLHVLCHTYLAQLEADAFTKNPWVPERLPVLKLIE